MDIYKRYHKVKRVIKSCKTKDQLEVAEKYATLFLTEYKYDDELFRLFLTCIMPVLTKKREELKNDVII